MIYIDILICDILFSKIQNIMTCGLHVTLNGKKDTKITS